MDWMGLRWEIGEVFRSRGPFEFEVTHVDTVLDPVISHVDSLAALDFGSAIGDAASWSVIIRDDSR